MTNYFFKLRNIEIDNFMTIQHGNIAIPYNYNTNESGLYEFPSEILGIYGMNGTGKSSFIKALSILKKINHRKPIKDQIINDQADHCSLSFTFHCFKENPEKEFIVLTYSFSIKNIENKNVVFNEKIKITNQSSVLLSANTGKNCSDYNIKNLIALIINTKQKDIKTYYKYIERIKNKNGAFLLHFLEREHSRLKNTVNGDIITNFIYFLSYNFQIKEDGLFGIIRNDLNSLRYDFTGSLKDRNNPNLNIRQYVFCKIDLASGFLYAKTQYLKCDEEGKRITTELITQHFNLINVLLKKIINGLTVSVNYEGIDQKDSIINNRTITYTRFKFTLWSNRNNNTIPFTQESYGIKKIFFLLLNITRVMNNKNYTLVVDEIDEGIFEYLLGDILTAIKENGHGQLIFTAHNLIPAERLSKRNIWFTTNDPLNRFIHLTNLKNENNLREIYFKEISGKRNTSQNSLFLKADRETITEAFIKSIQ